MVTGLLSRELANDTGVSMFYFLIVPGYRVFLLFHEKPSFISTSTF